MARVAIDVRERMACRWISCLIICRNTMAGIAAVTHNSGVGVVGVGRHKTDRGMTVAAFCVGNYMVFVLTCGDSASVATGTHIRNTRMIKAAVRFQVQEMGGIVAEITFSLGWLMKLGFTDGQHAIVTFAASSKNLLVIDKGGSGKSQGCMAGLAHITGSDMIRQFR